MTGISLSIYPPDNTDHLLMTFANDGSDAHLVVNTAADQVAHQAHVGHVDRLKAVQNGWEMVGIVFSLEERSQ